MKANLIVLACAGVMLSACGGSGVETPDSVRGTWAADCASPFIKIEESRIHVYPDNADYDLKSARLDGGNLTLAYDTQAGAVSEVYAVEGDTLRLDHGTYAGSEATWHKQPMKKCS